MLDTDTPWTSEHRLDGVPKHPRHRDIIQVAYGAYVLNCRKLKIPVITHPIWVVDVSQQVDRRPWGPNPRSFNKGSLMYVFALDRVLTVEDWGPLIRTPEVGLCLIDCVSNGFVF